MESIKLSLKENY